MSFLIFSAGCALMLSGLLGGSFLFAFIPLWDAHGLTMLPSRYHRRVLLQQFGALGVGLMLTGSGAYITASLILRVAPVAPRVLVTSDRGDDAALIAHWTLVAHENAHYLVARSGDAVCHVTAPRGGAYTCTLHGMSPGYAYSVVTSSYTRRGGTLLSRQYHRVSLPRRARS